MHLKLETRLVERDDDGALFVRYTPVLDSNEYAFGTLTFPGWQCGVCESKDAHSAVKRDALENVQKALEELAWRVGKQVSGRGET